MFGRCREFFVQGPQINPQVVRIKETMSRDVLEVHGIGLMALRRFSQDQPPLVRDRQVSPFLIIGRPLRNLHDERDVVLRHAAQDLE